MTEDQPLPLPLPFSASRNNDIYDPDDVGLRNSPPLKPMKVRLEPSPSPPPTVPLPQVSPESSPGPQDRKSSNNRPKYRPSQGDAVLISFMAGGKYSDIARDAGAKPLASDNEEAEEAGEGTTVFIVEEEKVAAPPTPPSARTKNITEQADMNLLAIQALARDALRQTANGPSELPDQKVNAQTRELARQDAPQHAGEPMEGVKTTMPPISTLYVNGTSSHTSPRDSMIKRELAVSSSGELPPMRTHSPKTGLTNGHSAGGFTLPSIADQLGDINHLPDAGANGESTFSQSPPTRPPPRFSAVPSHGSPKSPNDAFRRELPSPSRGNFYYNVNSHRRPSQADGPQYANAADYSGSNTETPSTDQSGSTPATAGIDRMSIDGITNPQIGGFICTYSGCTAQPFQTQYLLNSHANVHSSNRPHYCSVKDCPRSEGGKGFKRKNEMIRHGLVHDSPGYVCPFCPDREHKYPRPDNLQRHVRVHHTDKDKDDPQLRDVLSQRPEGPSRGRRRRGGTS